MANEGKKKKKGSYGKVLGYCVAVSCVAALLAVLGGGFGLGGGGFGLPWGSGNGSGNANGNGTNGSGYTNETTTQTNDPDETDASGDYYDNNDHEISENGAFDEPVELLIRVVNDRIYHIEREVTLEELVSLFEGLNSPDATWELRDEQAIMETFENVQALMRENGVVYVVR